MVEFGAKLSLKDNMYSNLQKNLKMQKQFSEQVKKTSNNIKGLGKAKANPIIAIKDKASAIMSKVKDGLKAIGSTTAKAVVALKDGATAGLSKIKSALGALAKGVTIAVGIAGAGASLLMGGAISEGAGLEQSIGGVNTLYGDDAGAMVKANADKAYQTAGLSANAYMETVTSFSASLLSSLGGNATETARIADQAIIDMADNANKMGTDIESIQNAYQGFAKQNYTMLDNLKLGYGGTQEEMQRLLDDASKLSGVEYDMSNLADVYNAIHVVQENLGIAGATALEASTTFSGSFASMKASAKNLLGNMAIGGDVTGSMEQLIDTATTFLFDNAIPMIGRIFESLPDAIGVAIEKGAPKIKQLGGTIVKALKSGLISLLPSSMGDVVENAFSSIGNIASTLAPVVKQIGDMFGRVAPVIANTLGSAFGDGGGFVETFANVLSNAMPLVEGLITGVANAITFMMPIVSSLGNIIVQLFPVISSVIGSAVSTIMPIMQSLGTHFQTLIPVIMSIVQSFAGIIQQVFPIVSGIIVQVVNAVMPKIQAIAELIQKAMPTIGAIIEGVMTAISTIFPVAWDIISPIIDVAITVIGTILEVVEAVFPVIQSIISDVWGFLEPIFTAIGEGFGAIGDAIGGVADFIGNGIDTIAGWFGFAYGKDRVPYDNYPAVLHQGEKVLTRNQADQYERVMSTRGVSVSGVVAQVPASGGNSTGKPTVNIEKLADTVVIEKEADVDKVVEEMIIKFRKLVPNMA